MIKLKFGWRIWVLIIAVAFSILAISPSFQSGVVVKYVNPTSDVFKEGLRTGETLLSINSQPIKTLSDYASAINSINFSGDKVKLVIVTNKNSYAFLTNQTPDITVDNLPKTRIQTGLDLRGGARALVQPDANITDDQLSDLIAVSNNRFNVYGLADVGIRGASDLEGNKYMIVEVAGATPGDLQSLIAQQGKFEAKIGNKSDSPIIFTGGNQDIKDVCRTAQCSGVYSCDTTQGGWYCNFRFAVYLNPAAAQTQADITRNMTLDSTGKYLSEKLYLYVDDTQVDSLNIGADLRGLASTQISIEGSGTGSTQAEALAQAKDSMKKLQTILITGSLPYKLNIVKLDTISPTLGETFIYWIFVAGIGSIILVGIIVFAKYRKIKESLAVLATSLSEILIILGVAAFVKWNLDLPSIAGILATIGTGVDQQIVILDEARTGLSLSLKEKMKRALFIVFSAYSTALVSLIPLYWAGAGLFKGFAITTIIGITAGVLITRPAFSEIIRRIEEK